MAVDERYLLEEARQLDPDRYLCSLFAPAARRRAVLALVLFNAELARIPDLVSQPMAGMIRFQWWREALEEAAAGRAGGHPVVEELAAAMASGAVEEAPLQAILDAREGAIEDLEPQDLEELETYLRLTAGRLGTLTARCLDAPPALCEAAGRVGLAYGMVGIIRALGGEAARNRHWLPEAMLAAQGVAPAALAAGEGSQGLQRVVEELLARAGRHLAEARAQAGRPPRELMAAFLPGRLARRQMACIRKAGCDPFRPQAPERSAAASLDLSLGWLTRSF
ncbi:phytoene/squalene synthase family protein [Geminicoccaceae bacterium 1502E]|nr:phytoene/squalene synthase family protein [Geminicoccaceae bacterium 1502E]